MRLAPLFLQCAVLLAVVVNGQSGWSRDGSSLYHRVLFTAPSAEHRIECVEGIDAFGVANHALSRLNFFRRWGSLSPVYYDAALMLDAQAATDAAPATSAEGDITVTEVSSTETSVAVYGRIGALALDHVFQVATGTTVRSLLLSQDLTGFGVGSACACGQEVTVLLLQHASTPSPVSATSWAAWPPSGWLPYTLLPRTNVFSFHWPNVDLSQAVVSVTDGYGASVPVQVTQHSPALVFSVDYKHRRLFEDLKLHVEVDTNASSAAHPEVVTYAITAFNPDPNDLCCYNKLTLSTAPSAGSAYEGTYKFQQLEEFVPAFVRNDSAYVLYHAANHWRIAATGATLDDRTDVATAFAPAIACPSDIESEFVTTACPQHSFSFKTTCNKPLTATPFPTTTGPTTTAPPTTTTTTTTSSSDDEFATSTTWTSTSSSSMTASSTFTTWESTTAYNGVTTPPATPLPEGVTTTAVAVWPFAFPNPHYTIVFLGVDLGATDGPKQFTTAFTASALVASIEVQGTDACTQACDNAGSTCKGVFLYAQATLVCRLLSDLGDVASGQATDLQSLSLRREQTVLSPGSEAALHDVSAAQKSFATTPPPAPPTPVSLQPAVSDTKATSSDAATSEQPAQEQVLSALHAAVAAEVGALPSSPSWVVEAVGALASFPQHKRFDSVISGDGLSNGVVTHSTADTTPLACLNWCQANPALCARVYVVPTGASGGGTSSPRPVACKMLAPPTYALSPPTLVADDAASVSVRLPRAGEVVVDIFGDIRPGFTAQHVGGVIAKDDSRQFSTAFDASALLSSHLGLSVLKCTAMCAEDVDCAGVFAWLDSPPSPVACRLLTTTGTAEGVDAASTSVSIAKA